MRWVSPVRAPAGRNGSVRHLRAALGRRGGGGAAVSESSAALARARIPSRWPGSTPSTASPRRASSSRWSTRRSSDSPHASPSSPAPRSSRAAPSTGRTACPRASRAIAQRSSRCTVIGLVGYAGVTLWWPEMVPKWFAQPSRGALAAQYAQHTGNRRLRHIRGGALLRRLPSQRRPPLRRGHRHRPAGRRGGQSRCRWQPRGTRTFWLYHIQLLAGCLVLLGGCCWSSTGADVPRTRSSSSPSPTSWASCAPARPTRSSASPQPSRRATATRSATVSAWARSRS